MSRILPACCAALFLALPASLPAAVADISLSKNVSASSVPLGTALTYTLMVHNAGPDDAQNVVLVDLLPAVATLVSMQSDFGTCTQSADTITCRLDTLTNGGTATLMLTVIPTSAGTICNFARVTSDQTDPNFSNNKASVCAAVSKATSGADLSVSQVAMPDPIPAGGNVTYTIRVHNNGPEAATNLRLTDTLPTNTTFVSASPDCVNDGGIVSCTIPKLNKNGTATKTIVVSAPGTGQVCNAASVLSSGTDPATANNTDTLCSFVTAAPQSVHDFAVTKITAPPSVVLSGKKASITKMVNVQIQNRSPQNETISSLDGLVTLKVESLGLCPDLVPVLRNKPPQKNLPVTLKPKQTLNVYFDVTFTTNCVNDHLKSSKSDPGHVDYRYHAAVHHEAIDGIPDTHPSDDTGPRSVQAPSELEPNPDGKIQDRGVGGLKSDHTFGADVLTDVVAPSDSAVNSPTNSPPPATNHPPIAVDDTAFTTATAPVDIHVLANDTDPDGDTFTVTDFVQPTNGLVTFSNNVATYTAKVGFFGTNVFTYTISDGRGGTATGTVSVTVTNPTNPPPVWETSEIGAVWSDDFNRATLGPNWIVLGGANASVVSNELMLSQTSLNNSRQIYYDPWQICSDSWTIRWSQRFGALDANSRGVGVGIKNFQAAGGNDRGYNGLLVGAGSDIGQMQIQRFDGSQQVLAAAGTAISLLAGQVVDCSLTRSGWTITATASNRATMQVSTASITFSDAANLIAPTISRMCFYPLRGTVYMDDVSFTINHRKPARFIIVGASISDGYNASVYAKTYGRVVQSNFTQVVCNDSSSYNSTSNSVSVLPEILAHQPGTAVLMIGGNDLLFVYPATQWQSQYSNLVAQLQANGVKVKHCLNTPRKNVDLRPLNSWILSTYPTNDIIDTWTPLLQGVSGLNPAYDGDATHLPDGVHPNDAGHLVIGTVIRSNLQ